MGEIIHYIIVIPLILLIIYYQIRVFVQASHKIETFKSIFPTNKHAYSISKVNIITNDDELQPHKEEDNAGEIWRDDEDEDEDEREKARRCANHAKWLCKPIKRSKGYGR